MQADLLGRLRGLGARLLLLPRGFYASGALVWIGLIAYLSSQTLEEAPGGPIWRFLGNGVHVPLFGFLALWVALALPRRSGDSWPRMGGAISLAVIAFVALNGAIDEWHQSTTGRTASISDVLTDTVAAGWVVVVASYAGRSDASASGARGRLWGGVALCLVAVAIATFLF